MSELHEAIVNNDIDLVVELIMKGADVNAIHEGQTPIYTALVYGRINIFELLDDENDEIYPSSMEETPLYIAIHHNQTEMIKYLVNRGDNNVNQIFYCFETPLKMAIHDANLEMVKFLVKIGADVNNYCEEDDRDQSPLIYAMSKSNIEIIKYLIDNGANVNDISTSRPVLIEAIEDNMFEVVKSLIKKGANVGEISEYLDETIKNSIDTELWDCIKKYIPRGKK